VDLLAESRHCAEHRRGVVRRSSSGCGGLPVLVVFFSATVLEIGAVAGSFGGAVGGWLFEQTGGRTPEPGS
jgi:hypothetical protein